MDRTELMKTKATTLLFARSYILHPDRAGGTVVKLRLKPSLHPAIGPDSRVNQHCTPTCQVTEATISFPMFLYYQFCQLQGLPPLSSSPVPLLWPPIRSCKCHKEMTHDACVSTEPPIRRRQSSFDRPDLHWEAKQGRMRLQADTWPKATFAV